jgi:ribosome maturation factor RimP
MAGRAVIADVEKTVEAQIVPLIEGLGFSVVELAVHRSRQVTHVRLVIHREPGVTVEDCKQVSRTIKPRLEMIEGLTDLAMEVSSPGIDRRLKRKEEYAIFRDRGVRLLLEGQSEWTRGTIRGLEGDRLSLEQEGNLRVVSLADIRAARLDDAVEGRGTIDQTQEVRR